MLKRRKPQKNELSREEIINQWLVLYPIRELDFEEEDAKVTVLVPHPESWLTRTLLPKPKHPAQRIHLDEVGSFAWRHFDGKHTLKSICEMLERQFGEKVKPARERIVIFAQQMYKQNFIKLYEARRIAPEKLPDPAG
jgi:hypothetical protein